MRCPNLWEPESRHNKKSGNDALSQIYIQGIFHALSFKHYSCVYKLNMEADFWMQYYIILEKKVWASYLGLKRNFFDVFIRLLGR